MPHLAAHTLFHGPLARVHDVVCTAPRSPHGPEEEPATTQVVLPRRGVFAVHRGGEPVAAAPGTALVLAAGDPYRVSHPVAGGDACTVLGFASGLVADALGDARQGQLRPRTQLAAHRLAARLFHGAADPLDAEEAALGVLAAVGEDLAALPPVRLGPAQRRRVEQVRLELAARTGDPWRLGDLAATVQCSPFHLARQFRGVTGETIGRALRRLRLGLALDRLAGGEEDLARLAADLGFAHHSHFSARFRGAFGITPRAAREALSSASGRRRALERRIVTADRPGGA